MAATKHVTFDEAKFKKYIADKAAELLQAHYNNKEFTISGSGRWYDNQKDEENRKRYEGTQVLRYSATASADANGVITVTIKPVLIITVKQIPG